MTLNASGPLSLGGSTVGQSINLELGQSATALASINASNFRTLAGVASGQISISNFYGKSNTPPYFVSSISNSGSYSAWVAHIKFAASGKTYVAGRDANNLPILTQLSSTGAELWSKTFSTSASWYNTAVNEDSSGNVYFATNIGNSSSTGLYWYKFDSSGTELARYNIAGTNYNAGPCAIDSSGNTYFTTYIGSFSSNSMGLVKVNTSGAVAWNVQFSSFDGDATGYVQGGTTPQIDSSGNVYIVFRKYNSSFSNFFPYIFKFDSAGNVLLSKKLSNTSGAVRITALRLNGNYLYCVYSIGSGSSSIAQLDTSTLNVTWARSAPTSLLEDAAPAASGGVIAYATGVGYFTINNAGSVTGNGFTVADTSPYPSTQVYITTDGANSMGFSASSVGYVPWNACRIALDFSQTGAYYINGGPGNPNYPMNILTGLATAPTLTSVTTFNASTTIAYATTTLPLSATTGAVATSARTLTLTTTAITGLTNGSNSYTVPGSYSWICPSGVTSVSTVVVSGGGGGSYYTGGGGAGLGYRNNISVTAGNSYTVVVANGGAGGVYFANGGGYSSFINTSTLYSAGGTSGTDGGSGGSGGVAFGFSGGAGGASGGAYSAGGGGAGGYSGSGGGGGPAAGSGGGGGGGYRLANGSYGGGGVGLMGQGTDGAAGTGSNNNGGSGGGATRYTRQPGNFGGGGGAGGSVICYSCPCNPTSTEYAGTSGGPGAVRIMWPGSTRSFPSTNTGSL